MQVKILVSLIVLLVIINGLLLVEIDVRYEKNKSYLIINKEFLVNGEYRCKLKYITDGITKYDTVDLIFFYNINEGQKYDVKEYHTPLGRVINRKIKLKCANCYYPFR